MPEPVKTTVKVADDEELVIMGRVQRMLKKLPSDQSRSRVMAYLLSRHMQMQPVINAMIGVEKSPGIVPGG